MSVKGPAVHAQLCIKRIDISALLLQTHVLPLLALAPLSQFNGTCLGRALRMPKGQRLISRSAIYTGITSLDKIDTGRLSSS